MNAVLTLGLVTASMFTAAHAQEPSYPLTCRGGDDMRVNLIVSEYAPSPQIEEAIRRTGGRLPAGFRTSIRIDFDRARGPARLDEPITHPPFHQCAWRERTVMAEEPANLVHTQHNLAGRSFNVSIRADGVIDTLVLADRPGGNCPTDLDAKHLIGNVLTGGVFGVEVYNNRQGNMTVTAVTRPDRDPSTEPNCGPASVLTSAPSVGYACVTGRPCPPRP